MSPRMLSKSRYLNGLQCLKYLWITFHEKEKIGEFDATTLFLFEQGHKVGELAKKLFPDGTDIPSSDFMGSIRETRRMIDAHKTIFEAAISVDGLYSRLDILQYVGDDQWDLIEVKSTTRVKDINVEDISYQKFCCEKAGLEIRKCFMLHINNAYVRQGDVEPKKLFTMVDITLRVEETVPEIAGRVEEMQEAITAEICPNITVGRYCNSPYTCPVTECRDFLPDFSVLELYRAGQKGYELLADGILTINEIPETFELTENQQIQKAVVKSQQPYTDNERIAGFLNSLEYPLYYLDFETFSTAIPTLDGTRPYQNIPFQFSLHVVDKEGSLPTQYSYLAEGRDDPRPGLLAELEKTLGNSGSIIVYNQSFESSVLKELGEAFPDYADWVPGINERMVDLFIPFRRMWYYHPAQKGSASLKAVLPALTGNGYEDLNINNGEEASLSFQRVTYGDATEEERQQVRRDLVDYCGLDTLGMVRIIEKLGQYKAETQGKLL